MIDRIDHFGLTARSLEATLSFYERTLASRARFGPARPLR